MREQNWWVNYPWRMVQTNFREIDMEHINAKKFAADLKAYHATVVTLNAAGILASYDTKLGFQKKSQFLHGDSLQKMVEECHKAGIKVIARCDFSKIPYEIYEENPDWAYRRSDGEIVNYNGYVQTCVNSEYQTQYIFDILRELFANHEFDGVFCNMSGFMVVDYDYNYHGPCHCENCKRLFHEQFGGEIPEKDDPRNPMYGKYVMFKNQCTKKQKQLLYQSLKAIDPAIAVNGFDYQRTECNQDMDRPTSIYAASTNGRKVAGPGKQMVCDDASTEFMGFRYRHTAISPAIMELRQWQNLANAGSTSVYIMGDMENHKDRSGLLASAKAFDFFAEHEDLYQRVHSAAKVLLVDKPLMARTDAEVDGWIRALTEAHIPFDEVALTSVTDELLSDKTLVILPDLRKATPEFGAMMDAFVEKGGVVLSTGATATLGLFQSSGLGSVKEKREKLLSSIFEIATEEQELFPETSKNQCAYVVPGDLVYVPEVLDTAKTKRYMHLIPEQKYGPPEICYPTEESEIPGVYVNAYGQGKMISIPWLVATFYQNYGHHNSFAFMKDVLLSLCEAKSLAPEVNPMCEFTMMEQEGGAKLLHLVNTSGCFGNSFFAPVPMLELVLDPGCDFSKATAYNGGEVEVVEVEGKKLLKLNRLDSYEVIRIQ